MTSFNLPFSVAAPHWPALRRLVTGGMAMVLCLLLGLGSPAVQAQGVELAQISAAKADDGLELSFSTRFNLSSAVEDALMKGVPVYFVADVTILRSRWYWRDVRAARASRSWRLEWKSLTRQFRVSTEGLNRNYSTLSEALSSLRGASSWHVAELKDIDDDGRYYLEFSYRLDTSQLPKPMQIGLGSPQGWGLNVERTFTLNSDFSLRSGS
ncbi:DUF4390 domain-containing protein [Roseateles koreensis]|uniref:DUF4390 domain-containing protein n=1 Tax=Roseateles koreensis TaxID=2987526 RepID=A0ABT5KWC5_9BURK|nr:DUF4390 domain-containing protein [Roseateles koreensis]MDC8787241.1 DUF4390 domain-containing protein [Roseateles koreensis]